MAKIIYEKLTNKKWVNLKKRPFLTVMTPVYNRRSTIEKTIRSVEEQTFRDIEYIIIDDGSTEPIDDIVNKFMESTKLPVMFVKKPNGGVHTARNVGYEQARGELVLCIDSDDELLPEAAEIFYRTWKLIPKDGRKEYWQMKAQCKNQEGKITGTLFPDGINEMPIDDARRYFSLSKGEQIGCRVTKIMKENKFPEPDGVTFVEENVRWVPLEEEYRSWGINDVVRTYHTEGDDHLSKSSKKKTKQDLRNMLWNTMYRLNRPKLFVLNFKQRLVSICKYCVIARLLWWCGDGKFVKKYPIEGWLNNFWKNIFWIPAIFVASIYYTKIVEQL